MTEFEELYRTYFDDVFRYIRRLSGSESIADEITSETFSKQCAPLKVSVVTVTLEYGFVK